jgi:hypothetical protein
MFFFQMSAHATACKNFFRPSRFVSSLVAGSFLALVACGSTQTVDSDQVPLKAGSQSDTTVGAPSSQPTESSPQNKPVQDIHQSYSATFDSQTGKNLATAQFRVRGSRGDTIRFKNASQTQFQNQNMEKIDGDVVNAVTAVLDHLLFIPFFSLLRTGTFYTGTQSGDGAGSFAFSDDYGNKVVTNYSIPMAKILSVPVQFSFAAENSKLNVDVDLTGNAEPTEVRCYLASTHLDAEKKESRELSSASGVQYGTKSTCDFFGKDLTSHANALKPVELKVEINQDKTENDALGRGKTLRTSRVLFAQIQGK